MVKHQYKLPSAVRTTGSQAFKLVGENASAYLRATAGVAPTSLDVKLQRKDPASGTWVDTGVAFAQVLAAFPSFERIAITNMWDEDLRWVWTIVGTSYTFSIGMSISER